MGGSSLSVRRVFEPCAVPAYGLVAGMASLVVLAITGGLFDYSVTLIRDVGTVIMLALSSAWLLRRTGSPRVAAPIEAVAVLLLMAILAPFCSVIAASANLPLVDARLAWIDSLFFGFDRTTFVPPINANPVLHGLFISIYNSFSIQPFVLLVLLFATGRSRRAWTLLTAWGLALIVSIAIFALVPAYGARPLQTLADVMRGARDGSLRTLDEATLVGIIMFPSFHAAGATMLAWGFAGFGRVALPLVAWNVAMIASALVSGGHYLIDLPVGVLVAAASIRLARRLIAQTQGPVGPDASPWSGWSGGIVRSGRIGTR